MLLESKVIHKIINIENPNKSTPLQQENIKNSVSQIIRKILLFQENAELPKVRRIENSFMACKFRLIICLSFHKKFGLKTICFA
jgi:hypothetical protein